MKSETLKCITSGLRKFHLTEAETEWVRFAESNLGPNNLLREMMGLTLERIYTEKTALIRDSVLSLLELSTPQYGSLHVPNHQNEAAEVKV